MFHVVLSKAPPFRAGLITSEWVEQPRWRQVIGNMLVRLAMRIGTTYSVE